MASGRAADREDPTKSKRRAARKFDRDPISELHQGQRSHAPQPKGRTYDCTRSVRPNPHSKPFAGAGRPHMISWSQPSPSGAPSTSRVSCGWIQCGSAGASGAEDFVTATGSSRRPGVLAIQASAGLTLYGGNLSAGEAVAPAPGHVRWDARERALARAQPRSSRASSGRAIDEQAGFRTAPANPNTAAPAILPELR